MNEEKHRAQEAPLVSVIIPTFNNADTIARAVESALSQSYRNLEVIVVDDGSDEPATDILVGYLGRICCVTRHNGGPSSARNTGIRHARGEWVAFLDSDDEWLPEKLAHQMDAVRDALDCGAAFTDFQITSELGVVQHSVKELLPEVPSGWVGDQLLWHNFICTSTVLARRSTVVELGGFDESLRQSEDWHLWMRLARRHRWLFVDEVLALHRQRAGNLSSNIEQRLEACGAALEKIIAEAPELRPKARRVRAQQLAVAGLKHLDRGDYRIARRNLSDSITTDWRELRVYPYLGAALAPRLLLPLGRLLLRLLTALKRLARGLPGAGLSGPA